MEKVYEVQNHSTITQFSFMKINEIEREKLEANSIKKSYKKNEIIYSEDSKPKGAYYLVKGMVKVIQITKEGLEQILFFYTIDELFGYRYLMSNDKHSLSAVCLEDCEIRFIPADLFLNLLDTSPEFTRRLFERVCYEFTIVVKRITIFAQKGIRARIAFTLLLLDNKFSDINQTNEPTIIRISRTNIGFFAGTSIDVVSRNLKYYSEKKWIKTDGKKIQILNYTELINAAGII